MQYYIAILAKVVYSSPIVHEIPTIAVDATGEKGCGINNRFRILLARWRRHRRSVFRKPACFVNIYHGPFWAARGIGVAAGDKRNLNFEYIITATESPPDDLKEKPWLLDPVLNAVEAKGRLLGVDL